MSQIENNLMVHQLPSDCYPPTDSDDESFVVLERSLAPDLVEEQERRNVIILSPEVIDQSIEVAADMLSYATSLSSTPNVPQLQSPKMSASITTISSDLSQDEIQLKVVSLIQENNDLKNTLLQNNMVMKNQKETLIQWKENVDKVQESHKKKFTEAKEYIKELQKENSRLVDLLRQQNGSFVAVPDLALNEKIKEQDETIKKLNIDLEQNAEALKEMANRFNHAQEEAKKQLSEQELLFDKKKEILLEQITALKVINEGLVAKVGTAEDSEKLKSQLMAAQVALTDLKQAKKATDAEIDAKKKEINKLESLLLKMNENAERTEVLEQQLLVYKADFEAERECKNKAIIDKNQLMEDLQNMQRRNDELLKEVETLRIKCTFVEVNSTNASAPPPTEPRRQPASTPSPPPMQYTCPLCLVKYRSLRTLEEHVESCINNSGH